MKKGVIKEQETLKRMIYYYCTKQHREGEICSNCNDIYAYALNRLLNCKFGDDKPSCRKCSIKCYREDMREEIRTIMRYSGPRIINIRVGELKDYFVKGYRC